MDLEFARIDGESNNPIKFKKEICPNNQMLLRSTPSKPSLSSSHPRLASIANRDCHCAFSLPFLVRFSKMIFRKE